MLSAWWDLRHRMTEFVAAWRPPPRIQRLLERLPPLPVMLPWLNLVGSAVLGLLTLGAWGLLVGPLVFLSWWLLAALWRWIGPFFRLPPPVTLPAATREHAPAASLEMPVAVADPPARATIPPRPQGAAAPRASILRRIIGGIGSMFGERVLPFTMLNLGLLAVLCTLIIGLDFAFWLALGAVPIILIGLMLMSLDGQEEAEDSLEEEEA